MACPLSTQSWWNISSTSSQRLWSFSTLFESGWKSPTWSLKIMNWPCWSSFFYKWEICCHQSSSFRNACNVNASWVSLLGFQLWNKTDKCSQAGRFSLIKTELFNTTAARECCFLKIIWLTSFTFTRNSTSITSSSFLNSAALSQSAIIRIQNRWDGKFLMFHVFFGSNFINFSISFMPAIERNREPPKKTNNYASPMVVVGLLSINYNVTYNVGKDRLKGFIDCCHMSKNLLSNNI